MKTKKTLIPTESQEQIALVQWCRWQGAPLNKIYAIPNGANKSFASAEKFRKEGLRAGMPDLCLPVARGGFYGLYIELKRIKGGVVSRDQKMLIEELQSEGYQVVVAKGFYEGRATIEQYMAGEKP